MAKYSKKTHFALSGIYHTLRNLLSINKLEKFHPNGAFSVKKIYKEFTFKRNKKFRN